jgi:ATP-binding cassette, subfamily B, bacterial MsbA
MYSNKQILKRLYDNYLGEHNRRIMIATFCMFVVAICGVANAWLLQPVLDDIFLNKNKDLLFYIPFILVFIAVLSGGANYVQNMQMRYTGQKIVADMQVELFSHLMHSDLALFHDQASGRLVSRFTNDIQMMRMATSSVLAGLAKELISLVFLVALMFYQSWQLSLVALLAFPIAIYPILRLGKRMRKVADGTQRELGEFTTILDETFSNVRVVKAYCREDFETGRAKAGIFRLLNLYMRASKVQTLASPMMEIVTASGIAMVIGYGGYQVIAGHNTPGEFFSFIAAMLMAYRPLRTLAGLNTQLQEGMAAATRFFAAIDNRPQILNAEGAVSLQSKGDIKFEDVSFHYDAGANIATLENISLHIPAGKMVALVGASGSGKTTIMNLLMRFYDVSSGRILLDGHDIRDVAISSLRGNIALVSQETLLFDDTVAANIAYGKIDATEAEIMAAAEAAAAHDFIMAMPNGYQTRVGPNGVMLSGGQRQRLCIARAFLRDAPILLLDEATSALDSNSEKIVQTALEKLMQTRTSLVIAHRLSTILHADYIYVLEAGKVVEAGTHGELLSHAGKYFELYQKQFGGVNINPKENNPKNNGGISFVPIHA